MKQADEMKVMLDFQTEQISSINASHGCIVADQMANSSASIPSLP